MGRVKAKSAIGWRAGPGSRFPGLGGVLWQSSKSGAVALSGSGECSLWPGAACQLSICLLEQELEPLNGHLESTWQIQDRERTHLKILWRLVRKPSGNLYFHTPGRKSGEVSINMAMIQEWGIPTKWLVDSNPHEKDVRQRVPKNKFNSELFAYCGWTNPF